MTVEPVQPAERNPPAAAWPPAIETEERVLARLTVTAEAIIAYASGAGETNPRHLDPQTAGGLIAPPTFFYVTSFEAALGWERLIGKAGLLSGERVEWFGDLRPGDEVTVWGRLSEAFLKTGRSGTLRFVAWDMRVVNQHGALVVRIKRSMAAATDQA